MQNWCIALEMLLNDNAPVHKARLSKADVAACDFEEVEYPSYSTDLAPSNYFCSRISKKYTEGDKI